MCKHERLSICEIGSWVTQHDRETSGEWSHNQTPGNYAAVITAECRDCGRHWKYSRYHVPEWLRLRLDEIQI